MSRVENVFDESIDGDSTERTVYVPSDAERVQVSVEQAKLEAVTTPDDRYEIRIYADGKRIGRGQFAGGTADSRQRPGIRRLFSTLSYPLPEGAKTVSVYFSTSKPMPITAHVDFF